MTDSITNELRSDILDGIFAPGNRLVELQLSDRYNCGRAAVRSALVELIFEGLVDREANRGATVRQISIDEAIQITEARAALESIIARYAARAASDEERVEVGQIISEMKTAVDAGENAKYSGLNARLHRRIREISGHTVASELVANLRNRAAHHQYRLALMPGRPAESLEQHIAIAEALIACDEAAAEQAMDRHLRSVIDVLRRWGDAVQQSEATRSERDSGVG